MIPGDIADDNNEDEINDIQKKFINTKGKCSMYLFLCLPNECVLFTLIFACRNTFSSE